MLNAIVAKSSSASANEVPHGVHYAPTLGIEVEVVVQEGVVVHVDLSGD